jgi:hypothetical protein
MRYVGGGSFFIGVPARDLTAEEAAQHWGVIAGSALYEPVETPAQEDAQDAEDGQDAGETGGEGE